MDTSWNIYETYRGIVIFVSRDGTDCMTVLSGASFTLPSQQRARDVIDNELDNIPPAPVNNPPHYNLLGTRCIDMIFAVLTKEEFIGFCKGCAMKYRFRAGRKGDALRDIAKAETYEKWGELAESSLMTKPSEEVK